MSLLLAKTQLTGPLWRQLLFAQLLLLCTDSLAHAPLTSKLERLDTLIEENPASPELLIQRAQVYSDQGEYERARLDLDLADVLEGEQRSAFTRAVMLYRTGDLDGSLQQLNRVLDANPENFSALEYRARIHRDLGMRLQAITDFKALVKSQTAVNPGYYLAAAKLMATDDNGVEDALTLIDAGLLRLGLIPQLQVCAVNLESRLGRTELALSRLFSLRDLLNNSPQWKADMARLYKLNGDTDVALDYYLQAQLQLSGLRPTLARQQLASRVNFSITQLR